MVARSLLTAVSLCLCPSPAMALAGWAATNAGKKVMNKMKATMAKQFSGSGDPEVHDCPHISDVLASTFTSFALKERLHMLFQQTQQFAPAWIMPPISLQVPVPPGPTQVADGWLYLWHFGHQDAAAVKGRSNMVNILEVAFSILENTFHSAQSPVQVLFQGQEGQAIEDFSVRFSVGFTRILACYTVLLAALELEAEELQELAPVLCSVFLVKYTYNPAATDALQRARALWRRSSR